MFLWRLGFFFFIAIFTLLYRTISNVREARIKKPITRLRVRATPQTCVNGPESVDFFLLVPTATDGGQRPFVFVAVRKRSTHFGRFIGNISRKHAVRVFLQIYFRYRSKSKSFVFLPSLTTPDHVTIVIAKKKNATRSRFEIIYQYVLNRRY